MNLPTMAVKISEKNYPVVVACLPSGFATKPKHEVLGHYIVINALTSEFSKDDRVPFLVVQNFWTTEEKFRSEYRFIVKELITAFAEVERI